MFYYSDGFVLHQAVRGDKMQFLKVLGFVLVLGYDLGQALLHTHYVYKNMYKSLLCMTVLAHDTFIYSTLFIQS